MDPTVKENLKKLPTNYSTWAVGAVSTVATIWFMMPEPDQKQLISNLLDLFPWLKAWMGPLSAALLVLVTRVIPQNRDNPSSPPETEKETPDA